MRFEVRYRNRRREVIVLAPFPEFARDGTGAAADEVVSFNPLDSGSESLTRMLCAKRASSAELETFFTEMERCLRAKIPESTALRLVTPLCTTPYFRGVISGLRFLLERHGLKLGEAMEQFPSAFDEVIVALVRAGETTGNQAAIFLRLSKRASSMRGIAKKFAAGLSAPAITSFITVVGMVVVNFAVLPNLEANFKAIRVGDGKLPAATQIMIETSRFMRDYPFMWGLPVAAIVALIFFRREVFASKPVQRLSVRLPIVGEAYRFIIMSRALDALALLNEEAVPIKRCYPLAAKVAGQFEYHDYFLAVLAQIERGRKPYSAFLAERHRIGAEGADIAARMEAASVTGDVSESLRVTAGIMAESAEARMEALPKVLGPLVSILCAVAIGIMVMGLFSPTFKLMIDSLKGGAMGGGK
jgi:type II secretory pathway component PulF